MPLRKKKHLDGVEPNSSKENSPVLRRRQVVRGRVPPDDSSSFETDEDFEKLTTEDILEDKPSLSDSTPTKKKYTNPRGSNFDDLSDKDIYEIQLRNLQSQLETAMIEKTSLVTQLRSYEEITDLKRVNTEMLKIREENKSLKQHVREVEHRLSQVRATQLSTKNDKDEHSEVETSKPSSLSTIQTRFEAWKMVTVEKFLDLLSDFSDEPDEQEDLEQEDGEELSVKRLKANIKRFQAGYAPLVSFLKAVSILLSWKSPSSTFLTFCIYMYCAWKGWLVTVMLALTIWLLGSTYFISRGWKVCFSLLPYHMVPEPEDDKQSLSMTDKYKLVFHVARKVQNWLGYLADQLEKLHQMIYWGNPEATGKLMKGVVFSFTMSVIFSGEWLFFFLAMAVGWKLFILNALYNKFPRFKAKYDTVHLFFQSLPTKEDVEQKRLKRERDETVTNIQVISEQGKLQGSSEAETQTTIETGKQIDRIKQKLQEDLKLVKYIPFPPIVDTEEVTDVSTGERTPAFCETFLLPASEYPQPGWEGGKRCTLINKDRNLTTAFRHGRLYLTNCNLCFGTSRLHHKKKNMVLNLKEITNVGKAKPFQFMPGRGMSIEVTVLGEEKPFLFSGLVGRDDVYREIQLAMEEARRQVLDETDANQTETKLSLEEPNVGTSKEEVNIYT
ncbi:putative GRAM domain-containing protein 4 [Apostichopus japonicus]|uniref:Putative GRAM domain-containing protein 4 n=1 Tax=Stichopus japonicus TaxID=307972 RepID=A0A2G8LRC3_STIJA|nr:putative GRAM domain-containing protein 4 [Apostichopus japonicus]